MADIFPKWTNKIPLVLGLAAPLAGIVAVGVVWYWFSPRFTDVGYRPVQPVPYSHKLHAGDLGLDCRYCHSTVETSPVAVIPPTQTCMKCHTLVKRDSPLLAAVRESMTSGRPLRWVRVHDVPDYAYFEHSVHVRAGVGCVSCHGKVHQMVEVAQAEPLSMSWCLDCHRNPAPHLRPPEEVTNMEWLAPRDHAEWAAGAAARLAPPLDCSGCHR